MGYLDNSGLSYLWGKIKTALGGKQDKESSVSVPGRRRVIHGGIPWSRPIYD